MSVLKRATIYLDPKIHKALKLKAADTDRPVSELVNEAVKDQLLEDVEDLLSFDSRKKEPSMNFDSFVKKLKKDGKI